MTGLTVFICADIEGVSGFVDWAQEDEETERVRLAMTEDVNAAVEGVLSERDADVIVNDSHGGKRNVVIEELHPDAKLVRGGPRPRGMISGVEDADVGFQIGAHTRPGYGGVLEHTFSSSSMADVTLNGDPVGEVELNAMGMAAFGTPTALVTGDDRLRDELEAVLPESEYVVTKEARSMRAATCYPPARVRERISDAAARAVSEPIGEYPLGIETDGTVSATVRYHQADTAEKAALWPGIERKTSRKIGYESDDPLEVYSFLRAASKV
ncbi:M55 family metallopeptidase [Halobellus litoreus]|uniref:M55 family metallopeptidase n=1 Tax=Halobellus litoreus TaxID=755310 RepID=A0ABD6DWL4_9EURY|nr:M55 family metallopeptidase [Halobellus litoreus]